MSRSIIAVVQARMASQRLPGKALATLGTRPVIQIIIDRLRRAAAVDEIILATTTQPEDDALSTWADCAGVACYRGSSQDVLDRFREAGRGAGVAVRITGDSPLVDPVLVDESISRLLSGGFDYVTNDDAGYIVGLDVEAVTADAIELAWSEASDPIDRTHVTRYIRSHPDRFSTHVIPWTGPSGLRWTLDEPADLEMLRLLFDRLGPDETSWQDAYAVVMETPEIGRLNLGVRQKEEAEG